MFSGYESDETIIIHDEYSLYRRMKTRIKRVFRILYSLFAKRNDYQKYFY